MLSYVLDLSYFDANRHDIITLRFPQKPCHAYEPSAGLCSSNVYISNSLYTEKSRDVLSFAGQCRRPLHTLSPKFFGYTSEPALADCSCCFVFCQHILLHVMYRLSVRVVAAAVPACRHSDQLRRANRERANPQPHASTAPNPSPDLKPQGCGPKPGRLCLNSPPRLPERRQYSTPRHRRGEAA